MRKEERESLARAKRASIIAQRAIEVLSGAQEAYFWLTSPCPALRGKRPVSLRYDVAGYRSVSAALRRRQSRMRAIKAAAFGSFADEGAFSAWLWSCCRALNGRLPATLLDTDRGAREVARAIHAARNEALDR